MVDTLGQKIKKSRRELGMSQRDLATELKISDKTISAYEVGRATPSLGILKEITKIVHKPISYFGDDEEASDIDLQIKLSSIEKELLEVKKLLQARDKKEVSTKK